MLGEVGAGQCHPLLATTGYVLLTLLPVPSPLLDIGGQVREVSLLEASSHVASQYDCCNPGDSLEDTRVNVERLLGRFTE